MALNGTRQVIPDPFESDDNGETNKNEPINDPNDYTGVDTNELIDSDTCDFDEDDLNNKTTISNDNVTIGLV